jgi:hypothetical protein
MLHAQEQHSTLTQHMAEEEEAHVEQETVEEQDRSSSKDDGEEEGAPLGEASSRSSRSTIG